MATWCGIYDDRSRTKGHAARRKLALISTRRQECGLHCATPSSVAIGPRVVVMERTDVIPQPTDGTRRSTSMEHLGVGKPNTPRGTQQLVKGQVHRRKGSNSVTTVPTVLPADSRGRAAQWLELRPVALLERTMKATRVHALARDTCLQRFQLSSVRQVNLAKRTLQATTRKERAKIAPQGPINTKKVGRCATTAP